jgi:hypothetical protein
MMQPAIELTESRLTELRRRDRSGLLVFFNKDTDFSILGSGDADPAHGKIGFSGN